MLNNLLLKFSITATYFPVLAAKLVSTGMIDVLIHFLSQIESNTGRTFCPNSRFHWLDDDFTTDLVYDASDHSMGVLDSMRPPAPGGGLAHTSLCFLGSQ